MPPENCNNLQGYRAYRGGSRMVMSNSDITAKFHRFRYSFTVANAGVLPRRSRIRSRTTAAMADGHPASHLRRLWHAVLSID